MGRWSSKASSSASGASARNREPGAGLDGGVVGNHDAADAGHMADHKRAAATGTPAMFRVHAAPAVANFQAGRVVVESRSSCSAVSLPLACSLAIRLGPPPWRACWSRWSSSESFSFIASTLRCSSISSGDTGMSGHCGSFPRYGLASPCTFEGRPGFHSARRWHHEDLPHSVPDRDCPARLDGHGTFGLRPSSRRTGADSDLRTRPRLRQGFIDRPVGGRVRLRGRGDHPLAGA